MATPAALRTLVQQAYPAANWDGECAGFAYLCCRLTGTVRLAYPSATAVRGDEMTRTVSPAPYGVPGLEFGNTSEYPPEGASL